MSEVCHDVPMEPSIQPLTGESFSLSNCNWNVGVHLDIRASSFWGGRFQSSSFDARTFNPYTPLNRSNLYHQHECARHHKCEERVHKIEHESFSELRFSSLVFSTTGGMGSSTAFAYKHLAIALSLK